MLVVVHVGCAGEVRSLLYRWGAQVRHARYCTGAVRSGAQVRPVLHARSQHYPLRYQPSLHTAASHYATTTSGSRLSSTAGALICGEGSRVSVMSRFKW